MALHIYIVFVPLHLCWMIHPVQIYDNLIIHDTKLGSLNVITFINSELSQVCTAVHL